MELSDYPHHSYYLEHADQFEKHLLCNLNQSELNALIDFVFSYGINCQFKSIPKIRNDRISWNKTFCYYVYPVMIADPRQCNVMDFTHDLAHVMYLKESQRKYLTLVESLRSFGNLSDSRWKGEEENHVLLLQLQLGDFLQNSINGRTGMIKMMDHYRYLSGRSKSVEQLLKDIGDPEIYKIEFPELPQFDDLVWIEPDRG